MVQIKQRQRQITKSSGLVLKLTIIICLDVQYQIGQNCSVFLTVTFFFNRIQQKTPSNGVPSQFFSRTNSNVQSVPHTSSEVQSLWVLHGQKKIRLYLSKLSTGKVPDDIMRSGSDRNRRALTLQRKQPDSLLKFYALCRIRMISRTLRC